MKSYRVDQCNKVGDISGILAFYAETEHELHSINQMNDGTFIIIAEKDVEGNECGHPALRHLSPIKKKSVTGDLTNLRTFSSDVLRTVALDITRLIKAAVTEYAGTNCDKLAVRFVDTKADSRVTVNFLTGHVFHIDITQG